MYKFGTRSKNNLLSCDRRLQEVLDEAIKVIDFTVLCGHRGESEQNKAFHEGRSKLKFPDSNHNEMPSKAVDIAPYPIDWNNIERFAHLIGIVRGIAHTKGYVLRCGCDWDNDGDITDQSFMDWPHIEIIEVM
jgi:peptidoglycan L-alanyl-D-glutamate endopeptidase CwlK